MNRPAKTDDGFIDYYEALQLSSSADGETIDRVYRMLAKRYHPDNSVTGNADRFRVIAEAHRVLSNPEQRAAFDARYEESRAVVVKIVDDTSNPENFSGDQRIFDALLSLLYISRRRDARKGGLGILQLERLLGFPSEHLEFHTWYLRQKGWIERLENGQLSITATGVDRVIEKNTLSVSQDRLLTAQNQTHNGHFDNELEHAKSNGNGSDNGHAGS
jgi:curved DNA-binding protein CbpA